MADAALPIGSRGPIFGEMDGHAPKIGYLDGPRLRRSLLAACEYARAQRSELNRINVFPVPDGDTGTNLALTVGAISDHLRAVDDRDASVVARKAAQAAVLGARGNCGMMLSHFLLGFAEGVGDRSRMEVGHFKNALRGGVHHLYDAIQQPVEGTILTVMRESAEAAEQSSHRDFVPLFESVLERAREALARTPQLLPVLKKAGVVDAGAKGFVSMLEGVLLFIHGDPLVAPEPAGNGRPAVVAGVDMGRESEVYRFCTEALVRGEELPSQEAVREVLREKGDSLIVIRSDDVLKVHIHTDEPDDVFAYLRDLGELATHKAEDMKAQHAAVERSAGSHVSLARRPVSIVTDSAANLPEEVVRAHGIHVTPLLMVTDDEVLKDGIDISPEEFHQRLADDDGPLPTTSQPAPADFLETYGRAAEDGEEILAVLLASTLSGTYGAGEAAARHFDGAPVHLVDSLGVSLLQGLLVLRAAELAELGRDPEAIARELVEVRSRSGILFTVDRFDRLLASGRVGRGRALLGTVLNVKPILQLNREGRVEPVDKVMGRKKVVPAMMEAVSARIPDDAERVRFGIVHIGARDVVPGVSERLRRRYGPGTEILTSAATPVIATHLGVGAWGVAYMVDG